MHSPVLTQVIGRHSIGGHMQCRAITCRRAASAILAGAMLLSPGRVAASSLPRNPIRADRSNVEVASTPPGQRDTYPGRESNSQAHERDPKGHSKPLGEVRPIVT